MLKKENLKTAFDSNQKATKHLLDDITEEESINPTRGLCNHIKWQTGHLAHCVDTMIRILGGDKLLSDEWVAPYKGGSEIAEDNSIYPPFEEIRTKLYESYDKLNDALENCSDDSLDEIAELSPEWKVNRFDGLVFFLKHEFYHLGQITITRKSLNRERPFG